MEGGSVLNYELLIDDQGTGMCPLHKVQCMHYAVCNWHEQLRDSYRIFFQLISGVIIILFGLYIGGNEGLGIIVGGLSGVGLNVWGTLTYKMVLKNKNELIICKKYMETMNFTEIYKNVYKRLSILPQFENQKIQIESLYDRGIIVRSTKVYIRILARRMDKALLTDLIGT